MRLALLLGLAALAATLAAGPAAARTTAVALPDGKPYDINWASIIPRRRVIWVNPASGNDAASGAAPAQALRTLVAAWEQVPADLERPYHIVILPGVLLPPAIPEWMRQKVGSYANPIIIEGLGAPLAVELRSFINIDSVSYIYFLRLYINHPGDPDGSHPFHAAHATGVLLRSVTVRGRRRLPNQEVPSAPKNAREVVKFNQVQGMYVEFCDFAVGTDNTIDAVAVQYGHVLWSWLHKTGFGVYFKGGSAHILFSGNRVFDTGEDGLALAAGFDTGLEWMVSPWIRYEAYDMKFVNNLIYRTAAPAFSVYSGYNILFAYNTLYQVGQAVDSLILVAQGRRECEGEWVDEQHQDGALCTEHFNEGGWGPNAALPWRTVNLPNQHVIIANNLVLNLNTTGTRTQHFTVNPPVQYCDEERGSAPGCVASQDLSSTTITADSGLQIRGNLVWNLAKEADGPTWIGFEWDSGCKESNPTCNTALVQGTNALNTIIPRLFNPAKGDMRLNRTSLAGFSQLWQIPNWPSYAPGPSGLAVPPGDLSNVVAKDLEGRPRTAAMNAPGAFIGY